PLGVAQALLALLRADRLRVPRAAPGPERQECALGQSSPLDRSSGSRAVAGAGRGLEDVPEVVRPPVGMLGTDVLQLGEPEASLVEEDEGIDPFVRHAPRR